MNLRYLRLILMILLVGSVLGIAPSLAQDSDDACPVIIETALDTVGDNCGALDRNNACYGYDQVEATFSEAVASDYFSQPSDRAELIHLQSLVTAALSETGETWGIALLNVQANVPNTLPGQAVVFMLIGDAKIENAVAPEDAFLPTDPVPVTTAVAFSNIRSAPNTDSYVIASVVRGTEFEADGRSVDGEWYRVIYEGSPVWINQFVLNQANGLSDLPVISDDTLTPMQAFYFRTGTGTPVCNEAPNAVVVQGPESMSVMINANGADITISSTIMLQSNPDDTIKLTALQGHAEVGGVVVPAGFSINAAIDETGTVRPGTWTGSRPMTQPELNQLNSFRKIGRALLHYEIQPPTMAQIFQTQAQFNAATVGSIVVTRCQNAGLSRAECRRLFDSGLVLTVAGFDEVALSH